MATLPAALLRHASEDREEPWLFRPEGWDWRWWSWGEAARRMSAWSAALAGAAAGSRLAFSYSALPDLVVLDLAIQAAGLVPVPLPGEPQEGEPAAFAAEPPFPAVALRRLDAVDAAEPSQWTVAAQELEGRIGPSPRRDIVVLSGPLDRLEERAMLSWATWTGAALVLEPNPAARVATAAWVRPTVFHGTAEELAALRVWAEKDRPRWWRRTRRPFGRLRQILVLGDGLDEDAKRFWEGRDVAVGGVESSP